jgi:hypothetical protein
MFVEKLLKEEVLGKASNNPSKSPLVKRSYTEL